MEDDKVQIPKSVQEVVSLKVSVVLVDGELMPDSIIETHRDLTIEGWNMLMEAYDDVDEKLAKTARDIQGEIDKENWEAQDGEE